MLNVHLFPRPYCPSYEAAAQDYALAKQDTQKRAGIFGLRRTLLDADRYKAAQERERKADYHLRMSYLKKVARSY